MADFVDYIAAGSEDISVVPTVKIHHIGYDPPAYEQVTYYDVNQNSVYKWHAAFWPKNKASLDALIGSTTLPGGVSTIKDTIFTAYATFAGATESVATPPNTEEGVVPSGWTLTKPTSVPEGFNLWTSTGVANLTGTVVWAAPEISTAGWIKPGTTLIDGNSIYTGDAYVDTLQIKGNAVTLNQAGYAYIPSLTTVDTEVLDISYIASTDNVYSLQVYVSFDIRCGTLTPAVGETSNFWQWEFTIHHWIGGSFSEIQGGVGIGKGDFVRVSHVFPITDSTVEHNFKLIASAIDGTGSLVIRSLVQGTKR